MDRLNPGTSLSVESREQELMMLARLRLAQGKPDEAEQILSPLIKDAEAGGGEYALIEMLALQVCVLNAKSDNEAAVEVLLRALTLADYVRVSYKRLNNTISINIVVHVHRLSSLNDNHLRKPPNGWR